jgi:hypothetical protein
MYGTHPSHAARSFAQRRNTLLFIAPRYIPLLQPVAPAFRKCAASRSSGSARRTACGVDGGATAAQTQCAASRTSRLALFDRLLFLFQPDALPLAWTAALLKHRPSVRHLAPAGWRSLTDCFFYSSPTHCLWRGRRRLQYSTHTQDAVPQCLS